MKKNFFISLALFCLMWGNALYAQQIQKPSYYAEDPALDDQLKKIIADLKLDGSFNVGEDGIEQISLAVIDLNTPAPVLSGVNYDNFIYPASVYKIYVAAAVLGQISAGKYDLNESFVVKPPNDVDRHSELSLDPRPLLKNGDTVNVNYLLDLMITRSDNSAANCLIDLATRPAINNLLHKYDYYGSEVTRKFVRRKFEDPGYDTIRGTMTCALHAADFLYRVQAGKMENFWVSAQLKSFMGRQLDRTKLAQGLPPNVMIYNKTGWWSYWTNDIAIIESPEVSYVIACFLPLEENKALPLFRELSSKVYKIMKSRSKK